MNGGFDVVANVLGYGPLGFLQSRAVFFGGQAALSVLYTGALYVLFCIGLVWALRRDDRRWADGGGARARSCR